MFRIVASSTISFGLGYMCATYGKGFTGTTRVETHIGSLSEGANLEFPSGILWRSSSKSMDDKFMYNNDSIYGVGRGLPTHSYPVYTYIHI